MTMHGQATSCSEHNTKLVLAAQYMTKTADYVLDQLHLKPVQDATLKAVQAARDSMQAAIVKARGVADPDVAVQIAWDAWTSFTAIPPGLS